MLVILTFSPVKYRLILTRCVLKPVGWMLKGRKEESQFINAFYGRIDLQDIWIAHSLFGSLSGEALHLEYWKLQTYQRHDS